MNETPASPLNVEPAPAPQSVSVALPSLVPKVTYALIGFTVFIYILQLLSTAVFGYAAGQVDWLEVFGARFNAAIRMGELWRFITPVFLHGSPAHISRDEHSLSCTGKRDGFTSPVQR